MRFCISQMVSFGDKHLLSVVMYTIPYQPFTNMDF